MKDFLASANFLKFISCFLIFVSWYVLVLMGKIEVKQYIDATYLVLGGITGYHLDFSTPAAPATTDQDK